MSDEERREAHSYPNVIRAIAETPWAILPERLAIIIDIVERRAAGERLSDEEIQERIGAGPASRGPGRQSTVAVLPLYGVLVPRASLFSKISGGTGLTDFQDAFQQAAADPQIDSIVIDVDSPGGSTDLVPETAALIRSKRGTKPIVAVANTMAASAAYWIASQADELIVTPSGEVGSIGVFAAHQDVSEFQAKAGIKTTLIRQPVAKADTNPFEPLTEEARQALQDRVDEFYGMFIRDVAKGRKVGVDAVRGGFGQGRVVTARNALDEGMVDQIDTLEATISRLLRGGGASGGGTAAFSGHVRTIRVARELAAQLAEGWSDPLQVKIEDGALVFRRPPSDGKDTDSQAATSGPSFADEASALRAGADELVDRLASLAEVERGSLTAAKREALTACPAALREAADRIDRVIAATDPAKHQAELELIRARANPNL